MSGKERWHDVGAVDEVPLRGARVVKTPAGPVALFRTADGSFFAIEDRCPHKAGPLSQGIVHGRSVTCPLHNLVIDLTNGKADAPEGGCVATFPVRTEGERILLDLMALERAQVA